MFVIYVLSLLTGFANNKTTVASKVPISAPFEQMEDCLASLRSMKLPVEEPVQNWDGMVSKSFMCDKK